MVQVLACRPLEVRFRPDVQQCVLTYPEEERSSLTFPVILQFPGFKA
jgi:hypothetical protein